MKRLPEYILRCFRSDFTKTLTYEELKFLNQMKRSFEKKEKVNRVTNNFLSFVKEMWPEFIEGRHHKEIADKTNY